MIDEEIKEAVDLVHEYGCIKAIGMGEEDTELINAFQTLIDLGKLYLTIAGKMPEERELTEINVIMTPAEKMERSGIVMANQMRQECILAQMKREQELKEGLPSVEELFEILDNNQHLLKKELAQAIHARLERSK